MRNSAAAITMVTGLPYRATIDENDPAATAVVTVTALDDDDPAVNDNGLIAYSINSKSF